MGNFFPISPDCSPSSVTVKDINGLVTHNHMPFAEVTSAEMKDRVQADKYRQGTISKAVALGNFSDQILNVQSISHTAQQLSATTTELSRLQL